MTRIRFSLIGTLLGIVLVYGPIHWAFNPPFETEQLSDVAPRISAALPWVWAGVITTIMSLIMLVIACFSRRTLAEEAKKAIEKEEADALKREFESGNKSP